MIENDFTKFLEMISKDEQESKMNAIKLVPKIMQDFNQEKASDLISFLFNSIDEEDETLISEAINVVAGSIYTFKNKNIISKLFPIVELGLISFNTKLREDSLNLYKTLLKECLQYEKDFDPYEFVTKLSNSISQKYRIGFLMIIPSVFRHLNSNQKGRVCSFLKQFSYEGTEYLKKLLAIYLKELAFCIQEDVFISISNILLENQNDNIRVPIINSIVGMKYNQNLNSYQSHIQKVVSIVGTDSSWRVRYTLAASVNELLSFSIISTNLKKEIVNQYSKMFFDIEVEVRNISFINLGICLEKLKDDEELINIIMENFEKAINQETSPIVKENLIFNMASICKNLAKSKIQSIIVPICLDIFKLKLDDNTLFNPQINNNSNSSKKINSTSPIPTKKVLDKKNKDTLLQDYLGKSEKSKKDSGLMLVFDNSGSCGQNTTVILMLIKNISLIQKYSEYNFEPHLLACISNNYNLIKWKSKVTLFEIIYSMDYFSNNSLKNELLEIVIKGLLENVYQIREISIKILANIACNCSTDEVHEKILKVLNSIKSCPNYQMRKCCSLFLLEYVRKKNCNESFLQNSLFPIILTIAKDKNKNIKTTCGYILKELIQKDKSYQSKVSKIIDEYSNDYDDELRRSVI